MNRSIQVAAALTIGVYSTYHTLSYIKEDCERQLVRQQQQKFKEIMAKNQGILTSVAKHAEKINIK